MDHKSKKHCKGQPFTLGVALSGGGARGFAHAGALKAIEDSGLRIDYLAGVSAGSVVAVLYAAGVKPERILEMFVDARFLDLAELTVGSGGFLRIDRFSNYLRRALGKKKLIEQLRIPTYIGVTNFDEGIPEKFSQGEIVPIVTASCSIPIAIVPQIIDGTTYVDGGVLHNLPAWTIRDKCDKLIGINVSPMVHDKRQYNSVISIAMRSYSLLAKANTEYDADLCDYLVTMDGISTHGVFKLNDIEKVYECGYERMRQQLTEAALWQKY